MRQGNSLCFASRRAAPPRLRRVLPASLSLRVCLFLAIVASPLATPAARAQGSPEQAAVSPIDVGIFVFPHSFEQTRVGVGYNSLVPHDRVKAEISRLAQGTGWQIANLAIVDDSLRPNDPKRFPKTTRAEFTLSHAPQVKDNAPRLRPYVAAFQTWNHLRVTFQMDALSPYNGVEQYEDKAITVQSLAQTANQGFYRYDVLLRDHTGTLPPLVAPPPAPEPAAAPQSAAKEASRPVWPLILILAGVGIAGGTMLYSFLTRKPTPPRRRAAPK